MDLVKDSKEVFQCRTISDGDKIIVKKDDRYKIISIIKGNKENFDSCKFNLDGAIGHPFGSLFIVRNGELEAVPNRADFDNFEKSKVEDLIEGDGVEGKDNRNLVDSDQNQGLKANCIQDMKQAGATGLEIMDKLVENSATFSSKTKFAQEKYLKKKKKRHLDLLTFFKPTTRLLCEMYTVGKRNKVLGLRVDTVSQILSYANVHSGSKVLLTETCAGLLLGAVLERQGSHGRVLHFFHGTHPLRPEVLQLNTGDDSWSTRVLEVPLTELTALRLTGNLLRHGRTHVWQVDPVATEDNNGVHKLGIDNLIEMETDEQISLSATGDEDKKLQNDSAIAGTENTIQGTETDCKRPSNKWSGRGSAAKRRKWDQPPPTREEFEARRKLREQRGETTRLGVMEGGWNALIVATKFHPSDVVLGMLHFLSPGSPIVVYCQFLEPLVDLLNRLKQRGNIGLLHIRENWLRSYQVLPERTHPQVVMSGTGGYLLTGYLLGDTSSGVGDIRTDYTSKLIVGSK